MKQTSELTNVDAQTVDEIPARNAETLDEVTELINAAADYHKAIHSVDAGSLVIEQDDGTVSGYVELENTTSYAAGQATKLLRAMGATVDRTPGATQNARVWFELNVSDSDESDTACPNCGGVDLKEGAAVENGKTFDYGCRDCRSVFNQEDAR